MRINEYQLAKGIQAEEKKAEFVTEHSLRTAAEELRDKYKADLNVVLDKLERIKQAIDDIPAVPTLSGLKAVINALKVILGELIA